MWNRGKSIFQQCKSFLHLSLSFHLLTAMAGLDSDLASSALSKAGLTKHSLAQICQVSPEHMGTCLSVCAYICISSVNNKYEGVLKIMSPACVFVGLEQGCPISGPRAKSGPRIDVNWPAVPILDFTISDPLANTLQVFLPPDGGSRLC